MREVIISVIMPAYNAERFIAESIESVIGQSESRWELLIMDDGSTDGTSEVIKKYCDADQRIRYYYQQNRGQGNARNNLICKAKGIYIAMIDADDKWTENKLLLQLDCIKKYDADLVFADIVLMNEEGRIEESGYGVTDATIAGNDGIKELLMRNKIAASTVIAKKKSMVEAGGFDEQNAGHYGEDYALWLRMLKQGAVFRGMQERFAYYRSHPLQATRQKTNMMHVLKMVESLHFEDEVLSKTKVKALKSWIARFIKSNPEIDQEKFDQVVAMFPNKTGKFFLKIVEKLAGRGAVKRCLSLLCISCFVILIG